MKSLQVEIDKTTKEIENLEAKLLELQKTKSSTSTSSTADAEVLRRKIATAHEAADYQWFERGGGSKVDNFSRFCHNCGKNIRRTIIGKKSINYTLKNIRTVLR